MPMFKTPFSPAYWKEAVRSFRSLRGMVFAALMVAACIVLSNVASIKLTKEISISFSYVARALCSLVYGPLGALAFGAVEDTLSFLLNSRGDPYFPGYLLTTMLGCLTYALFFFRTKITVMKIFFAKVLIDLQNIFLGTLWSAILYGNGYLFLLGKRAVKNLIQLPVDVIVLFVIFQAVLPVMQKMRVIPNQLGEGDRIKFI